MSLKFLGYEVNENELLNQEIIESWERVFNENSGTVTPVETTGDKLFYFKDVALDDNWVLGWVLDADKNLFQFGPVTKPFALVPDSKTFRERFGIKIEKIEKPAEHVVTYEYTADKEDLDKDFRVFEGADVQKSYEGTDENGRRYAEYKNAAGVVVVRLTLVEPKKEETEVKEEEKPKADVAYEFTSDAKVFKETDEYQYNGEVFVRGEEGKDELGRTNVSFKDAEGNVRLVLTLTEAKEEVKEEEKKEEEPTKEAEAPKVEKFSITVNGVEITKVDGHELPERKETLTPEEEAAISIANHYQENLKERTWDTFADGRVLVTDYLYSDAIKNDNGTFGEAIVRVEVVFLDTVAKSLAGYSIEANKKSAREAGKLVDALIEETLKNILGPKEEEKVADTVPSEEKTEATAEVTE